MEQKSKDNKKAYYKKWWFWLIVILILFFISNNYENNKQVGSNDINNTNSIIESKEKTMEEKIKEVLKDKNNIEISTIDNKVIVKYKTDTPLTFNTLLREVLSLYVKIGKIIYNNNNIQEFDFVINGDITDEYGNKKIDRLIEILMPKDNFVKYQWENLEYQPIYNIFIKETDIFYILYSMRSQIDIDKIFLTLE